MAITGPPWQLCSVEEITDPGGRAFEIMDDGNLLEIFVIHWRGGWYVYKNQCPHTGVNLNWLPDQFFDTESEFIQCSVHGALFIPDNGLCVHGPCAGEALRKLQCNINNGVVYIQSSN